MTEQFTLEQLAQRVTDSLGDLLSLQAGLAFPGKTHKIAADTASLARLWTAYRDRQFEQEHADDLADDAAYHEEVQENRALGMGLG